MIGPTDPNHIPHAAKAKRDAQEKQQKIAMNQEKRKDPGNWRPVNEAVMCTRCHTRAHNERYTTDILDHGKGRQYICPVCMQAIITAWENERTPLPVAIPEQSQTPDTMDQNPNPEKRKHVKRDDRR